MREGTESQTHHHGLEVSGTHCVHALSIHLHDAVPDLQQALSVDDSSKQNTGNDEMVVHQFQCYTLSVRSVSAWGGGGGGGGGREKWLK